MKVLKAEINENTNYEMLNNISINLNLKTIIIYIIKKSKIISLCNS